MRFFFFNHPAPPEIYTLSLHDALPICVRVRRLLGVEERVAVDEVRTGAAGRREDRKSTRLNSSHITISYAVFCLKKKKNRREPTHSTARLPLRCCWQAPRFHRLRAPAH